MGKVKVIKSEPKEQTEWFLHRDTGNVYRRGPDGIYISARTGDIFYANEAYKGSKVHKSFENEDNYTRLQFGDQIVITL